MRTSNKVPENFSIDARSLVLSNDSSNKVNLKGLDCAVAFYPHVVEFVLIGLRL